MNYRPRILLFEVKKQCKYTEKTYQKVVRYHSSRQQQSHGRFLSDLGNRADYCIKQAVLRKSIRVLITKSEWISSYFARKLAALFSCKIQRCVLAFVYRSDAHLRTFHLFDFWG